MNELYITDLIDPSTLKKVQHAFSNMFHMAALTTDVDGHPVTESSNFALYCQRYKKRSEAGQKKCEECFLKAALATKEAGKPCSFTCHSGLVYFAAPIMVDGKIIGSFVGGQVLTDSPDPERIRIAAEVIDADFDEFYSYAKDIPVVSEESIANAAGFIFNMAEVLSDMCYAKYQSIQANIEIEKASRMRTDFLANMSHEIRTPMNAVIGMAEMALREDIPDSARNYISQIKSSGRALLAIINDILDFSKIEAGKMDITPIEYDPVSLFNEVNNIIMTRLTDKNIEFDIDFPADFPSLLFGDTLRIRQILINLANNAVKFTNKGHVRIRVEYLKLNRLLANLTISVEDTGIGIKEEDKEAIFESFSQVDAKRNRNVEGTGLGLAITKRLLSLMDGRLTLESEYNKGSTFSFTLPQVIANDEPVFHIEDAEKITAICCLRTTFQRENFLRDANRLNIPAISCQGISGLPDTLMKCISDNPGKDIFVFVNSEDLSPELTNFINSNKNVTFVIVTDFLAGLEGLDPQNALIAKSPISTLNLSLIFNRKSLDKASIVDVEEDSGFIAPDAKVLIVDDNSVNLTVAEGLLEPIKVKIYKALNGKEAIALTKRENFDIILMDHMMPEMDGIETAKIIRRLHEEYRNIPIIAVTANAMEGAREMFISEGLEDFIPKPVEVRTLHPMIRKWLPESKIKQVSASEYKVVNEEPDNTPIVLGDLDTEKAISLLGSKDMFFIVLKEYYKAISKYSVSIKEFYEKKDIENYTIQVHALKSSSKQIGAMELSDMAAELEKAGKAGDLDYISQNTEPMLKKYVSYLPVFAPYCEEKTVSKDNPEYDRDELVKTLNDLREAADDLDFDTTSDLMDNLLGYSYPDDQTDLLNSLKEGVDEMDPDICEEIIEKWLALLG